MAFKSKSIYREASKGLQIMIHLNRTLSKSKKMPMMSKSFKSMDDQNCRHGIQQGYITTAIKITGAEY